jgi:hypothetical protein
LDIESRQNSTNKATVKTTKSTKAPKLMTPASPIMADDEYAEDEFEQTPALNNDSMPAKPIIPPRKTTKNKSPETLEQIKLSNMHQKINKESIAESPLAKNDSNQHLLRE